MVISLPEAEVNILLRKGNQIGTSNSDQWQSQINVETHI
jgi:hypothetical protein